MSIAFCCDNCGRHLRAPDTAAGKNVKCPRCGGRSKLPEQVRVATARQSLTEDAAAALLLSRPPAAWPEGPPAPPGPTDNAQAEQGRQPRPAEEPPLQSGASESGWAAPPREEPLPHCQPIDRELVRKFRGAAHGVGGWGLILGALCLFAGLVLSFAGAPPSGITKDAAGVLSLLALVVGALWLTAGVCACFKRVGGIYLALVLGYVNLLGHVVSLVNGGGVNVIGILVTLGVLTQAHQALKLAREMREAGIPLNARPD